MNNINSFFSKILLFFFIINIFSPAFASETSYNFDNTNTSNIYAFSGSYLNGSNLDLSKSNTNLLRWRGNGNGWGIDTNEQ